MIIEFPLEVKLMTFLTLVCFAHFFIAADSFDDSSSISSGISDLNEVPTDLTSSSVNSEISSPYASLKVTDPFKICLANSVLYKICMTY